MSVLAARLASARAAVPSFRWLPLALAASAGCLFLAVAASPPEQYQVPPFLDNPFAAGFAPGVSGQGIDGWQDLLFMLVPVAVTAVGLCLIRWWPYLLARGRADGRARRHQRVGSSTSGTRSASRTSSRCCRPPAYILAIVGRAGLRPGAVPRPRPPGARSWWRWRSGPA